MREAMSLSVLVAVGVGITFGAVTAVEGALARFNGAIKASLFENIAAGTLSIVVFLAIFAAARGERAPITSSTVGLAVAAGVLVVAAVAGIGYAIPRIGVMAGNMAIVFGQIAVALVIDSLGLGGYDPIPLKPVRIFGVILLGVGLYLALPRTTE